MSFTQAPRLIITGLVPRTREEVGTFQTLIDSKDITFATSAEQSKETVQGGKPPRYRFKGLTPGRFQASFILDRGIIVDPIGQRRDDDSILPDIMKLKNVTVEVDEKSQQPPIVRICWGNFVWCGSVTTLDFAYLLHSPDGRPLRARVSLVMDALEVLIP